MVIHMVKAMVKATHKAPARVRYEQTHPTLTCRLDQNTHALLKQRMEELGGISFAALVKHSLGLLQLEMPNIEEIKQTAWGEGYDHAKKGYQIWYYCNVCQKRIDISPNSDSHKAIVAYMKLEGWGHHSCHQG